MKALSLAVVSLALVVLAVLAAQRNPPQADKEAGETLHALGGVQPRLSPDGTTIAFSYQGSLWIVPRAGGVMTRLSDGPGFAIEPVWSPDGKCIAYVDSPNTLGGELRLLRAGDGQPVALPKPVQVRGTAVYYKLEFHPDGRRILGAFRAGGKDWGLAWFDIQSGDLTTITMPPTWARYALSPDGRWLAYTQSMDVTGQQMGNDGPQADVWKVSSDGGKAEKIVRFPSRIHDLCWTADGQGLIVVSELGGVHNDLWQLPLKDPLRGLRKLTFGQADEDRPSLSRNGRWLLYSDNHAGPTAFIVRDRQTGLEQTVPIARLDFRCPTGTIRLQARDAESKKPVVARISLQKDKGGFHAPPGALYRVLRDYAHFYCEQSAEWSVPAGKYRLRAFRGPEYRVTDMEVEVAAGQTRELTVDLTRWTNQARAGWFSGENHIHANYGYGAWYNTPRTMLQQCSGEDLNVCNFMVANSDTDGVFDRPFFRGGPDPLSTPQTILYWNQEFRSTHWGHMTLVNLRQVVEPVFTGFKDTTNPWDIPTNSDVADRAHWQKGHVNYTHLAQNADDPFQNPYAGKGIPIDVAAGKIDSVDINASYDGTVPIWHRLLNCGFRLPASAGTDCFLNRINSRLPGGDRVYVWVDGPLTYAGWIAGLKAGRSFVSNGPVLELTINNKSLGDTISLPAPASVKLRAVVRSQFPLNTVEVIHNGKVLHAGTLAADRLSATIERAVQLDKSGWIALRARGPNHPHSSTGSFYAHSNPIYIEVGKDRPRSRDDALYFLAWIDRLSLSLRERNRIPTEPLRRQVQEQLEAARAIYERMAVKGE